MEEKIIEVPVYKQVAKGTKKVTVFVAYDGTEHRTKNQCNKHEEYNKREDIFESIKVIKDHSISDKIPFYWYHIENDEQLQEIKRRQDRYRNSRHLYYHGENSENLAIGDWVGWTNEDGGDYGKNSYYFYTLNDVKKEYEEFMVAFTE